MTMENQTSIQAATGIKVVRNVEGKLMSATYGDCFNMAGYLQYVPFQRTFPKAGCGPIALYPNTPAGKRAAKTLYDEDNSEGIEFHYCYYVPSAERELRSTSKVPSGHIFHRSLLECPKHTIFAEEITLGWEFSIP